MNYLLTIIYIIIKFIMNNKRKDQYKNYLERNNLINIIIKYITNFL